MIICKCCSKQFQSANAYNNHLSSRKHKASEARSFKGATLAYILIGKTLRDMFKKQCALYIALQFNFTFNIKLEDLISYNF